jgi:hypothetical protein
MSVFKTSDLQLSAFLVALGHKLIGVEGSRGRREFVFDEKAEADRFAYFSDIREVSPRKLFNAYRDLKNVLFEVH